MYYEDMLEIITKLEYDRELVLITEGNYELSVLRPSVLSKRFKNYDLTKNFQIFLNDGKNHFRPNHLRIMIDINLRVRSRPDLKALLLTIFDNIFYGKNPENEIEIIEKEVFEHYLNPIRIIANLAQLFLIEQDFAYNKKSNYDPGTLFFQGWIREFLDNKKEIDNLCMSVCKFQPPSNKYVCKENKNDKLYTDVLQPLWYLND